MKRTLTACLLFLAALLPVRAQQGSHAFEVAKAIETFCTIFRDLELFYVDTLDAEQAVTAAIDAMLATLDPYTQYYAEEDMGDLKLMTTGKYGGIGSIIRMRKDSTVIISEPYAGMPAAEVGLQVGDVLLFIDDQDLKGKSVSEVSDMLRGEPGTTFQLRIQRPGEKKERTFAITRRSIKVPAITYYGLCAPKVGYIYLSQFTENCSTELRKAFIALREQGVESIVIDLRDNGGGLLSEAVDIVNLFVPKGLTIVETHGKVASSNSTYVTQNDPLDTDIPVAVLVSASTASAAEIVSGALQDLDRAVIVGSKTFGKGLVQSPRELPYNASLKLTTSKYYIPSGRCIQAIDYAAWRQGKKATQADSLAAIFHTAGGREVKEGSGIVPDILLTPDTMPDIAYYLELDDILLDWGTTYMQQHTDLPPVSQLEITDADVADLLTLAKEADFKYDRVSAKHLDALKKAMQREGYMDEAKAEVEALEAKLEHNLDRDFARFDKEIRHVMGAELVRRYAYQAGTVEFSLRGDPEVEEAVRILSDTEAYYDLLHPATTEDE